MLRRLAARISYPGDGRELRYGGQMSEATLLTQRAATRTRHPGLTRYTDFTSAAYSTSLHTRHVTSRQIIQPLNQPHSLCRVGLQAGNIYILV